MAGGSSFDAAFAGCVGGTYAGAQTVDNVAADFATQTAAANAFATQVSAKITIGNVGRTEREILLTQICGALWDSRNPPSSDANFYDALANAVNAIYSNAIGYLQ